MHQVVNKHSPSILGNLRRRSVTIQRSIQGNTLTDKRPLLLASVERRCVRMDSRLSSMSTQQGESTHKNVFRIVRLNQPSFQTCPSGQRWPTSVLSRSKVHFDYGRPVLSLGPSCPNAQNRGRNGRTGILIRLDFNIWLRSENNN